MGSFSRRYLEADRKLLSIILGTILPSPHKAVDALLSRFKSLQRTVRADYKILAEIVGEDGAKLLGAIPQAVVSITRESVISADSYLLTLEATKAHLSAILNGRRNETFVAVYLNIRNRLIDEDIWEGSIDRATVYPKEIIRRAILMDASTIIIAHNHPSGDTTPSLADLRITTNLQDALFMMDIVLLDHLIFGEGEPYSMRENGDV